VVLSEPEPLDTMLQWPSPDGGTEPLRALLAALGQPRREGDRSLFLKTDCWHMIHIDRLLAAFPGTPWVFLYRDPVEVLVSHRRTPGWQMVPGSMAVHGLHAPGELGSNPLGHGAWVMARILEQAWLAMSRHDNGLLLNYHELPEALETRLAGHFGVESSDVDRGSLCAVTERDSKQRPGTFQPDSANKRAAADKVILELAARWLDEPYQSLEKLRDGGPPI
jgi:hypothetical protein